MSYTGRDVVATDKSEASIQVLKEKCQYVNGGRLETDITTATDLPFEDDSVPAIVTFLMYNFLTRKEFTDFAREAARVSIPGTTRLVIAGPYRRWKCGVMIDGAKEEIRKAGYLDGNSNFTHEDIYEDWCNWGLHLQQCSGRFSLTEMNPDEMQQRLTRHRFGNFRVQPRHGYGADYVLACDYLPPTKPYIMVGGAKASPKHPFRDFIDSRRRKKRSKPIERPGKQKIKRPVKR